MDPRTILFLLALVYLLMSGLLWAILRTHYDDVRALALWCAGGVLIGATYSLYWLDPFLPGFFSHQLPTVVGLAGLGFRVGALLRERGQTDRGRQIAWLFALGCAGAFAASVMPEAGRRAVNGMLLAGAAAWLAALARQVGRRPGGDAANLISLSYAFFAVVLAIRMLFSAARAGQMPALTPTFDLLLVLAGGLVSAIFGSVGYAGLALDAARLRREAQAQVLTREQAQRAAAEAEAAALATRLTQREEFVRVLAHEVRQPLNNASAALQGVQASLQSGALNDVEQAHARLQRAQSVIGHITGTVDNTLAATTVLASDQPLALHDADVHALVDLAIGDVAADQRQRVQLVPTGHARTAAMDIGLMRLALRNLLANALAYSPADTPVTLSITDTDEPLGLMFDVADQGPGLSSALQAKLFQRGVRGDHGRPSHGLGLHVVHEIMRRHGGRAEWLPNRPRGSVFRLWLPGE